MRAAFFRRCDADELRAHFSAGGDPKECVEDEPDIYWAPALYFVFPNVECMRILLEAGADPNEQDCRGADFLITAAVQLRLLPVIHLLVEFGALLNRDAQDSALNMSEKHNHRDITVFLMRKGAHASPWSPEYIQKMETARFVCKITCNALMRALKLQNRMHKDMIPIVVRMLWDMRFREDWVEPAPQYYDMVKRLNL